MTSRQAIDIFYSYLQGEPVVCATGYISRSAQRAKDRLENFYMIGSMGLASPIAPRVGLCQTQKKVNPLDGARSVLMNLGTLATIGALWPANFFHFVVDNGGYESTGNQLSHAARVPLDKIAQSAGYAHVRRTETPEALRKEIAGSLSKKGPVFILAKVSPDDGSPAPRVHAAPEVITENFSKCLR